MCLQKCQCGNENVCHPRTGKMKNIYKKKAHWVFRFKENVIHYLVMVIQNVYQSNKEKNY
jgi:hypothetical protein